MKILNKVVSYIPELTFFLLSCFWIIDFFMDNHINYLLVIISLIIPMLLIWKNKVFAIIVSSLFGIGSCYMILAVISEFREFPAGSSDGIKLLLIGCLLFIFLLVMSFLLPQKYFRNKS